MSLSNSTTIYSSPALGSTIATYTNANSVVSSVFNGRNFTLDGIIDRLEILEKILGVPKYDAEMVSKHPKLKKLYDDMIAAMSYSNLHAAQYLNELAKCKTWEALNT